MKRSSLLALFFALCCCARYCAATDPVTTVNGSSYIKVGLVQATWDAANPTLGAGDVTSTSQCGGICLSSSTCNAFMLDEAANECHLAELPSAVVAADLGADVAGVYVRSDFHGI